MARRGLIFLFGLMGLLGCKPTQQVAPPKSEIEMLIESRIGKDAVVSKNRDGSFLLCKKQTENPDNNVMKVDFIIIRALDKKVVEEGSVTMGLVEWSGEFEIEISPAPGQAQLQRNANTIIRTIDLRKYGGFRR